MKRNLTFQKIMCMLAAILIGGGLFAQTYNVPADFPTVSAAIGAIKADAAITAGAEVTINVAEGVYDEQTINQISKAIKLTIQGAGADKTTLKGLESRPIPGDDQSKRFFQLNNANNDGLELILKGVKFLNWGFGSANLQGGIVFLVNAAISVSFIDCEFEGIAARVGAIINSNRTFHSVTVDNCFVHNCLAFDNNSLNGLFNLVSTGKISITNSTFMSNEQRVLNIGTTDTGTDRNTNSGLIISVTNGADGNPEVTIENNVFVNNRVVDAGSTESAKPTIRISCHSENANANFVIGMKNNVFIGNGREGDNNDVDFYYNETTTTKLIFQNPEGNILSSFIKLEDEASYVPVEHAGFLVDASYTYTDPRIDFVMEGALPKVHYDDKGVGYLVYSGDGTGSDPSSVNELPLNSLVVYSLNGVVNIKGLNIGEVVEVYSLTGSLVARESAHSEQLSIALPRGLFIVRSGIQVGKVLVQ